ncbi:unnamed protein product [Lymnaea stagnalis]|uniref:Uncharacterized protein n=1 Tax=Lymnaea stagnalis TaxID=6523 RepID=A0AAV2IN28_LYMST
MLRLSLLVCLVLSAAAFVTSVQHGNWTLVFRGQRDINQAVTDRWLSNNMHDDNPVSPSLAVHCYRLDMVISCPIHFRSHILDKWSNIDKVKFAIYNAGSEVKSIIFNGTRTTRINWFQKSRVLSSSWSSLDNDTGIVDFAFNSRQGPPQKRRFAINTYGGCQGDTTYFEIFDTAYDGCMTTYKLSLETYPRFLYSPFEARVRISAGPTVYKLADIFAVFVQFTAP